MATSLRRGDITARVATRLGGSRAEGEAALNAVLGVVRDALSSGDRVVLTGFGAFWVTDVKERRVRVDSRRSAHNRSRPQAGQVQSWTGP